MNDAPHMCGYASSHFSPCPVSCVAGWQPCDRPPSLDLPPYNRTEPAAPPREAHWPVNRKLQRKTGGGRVEDEKGRKATGRSELLPRFSEMTSSTDLQGTVGIFPPL